MVETKRDNPTLDARVWVSEDKQYLFAEMESGVLPKTPNTGVCFSGGGTRSLSATMGQLRGLTQLNLIANIRYISCVSGGSWASTLYTYYKTGDRGPANDTEFLGQVTPPQAITMKGLADNDPRRLGSVATRSLEEAIIGLIEQGTTQADRLWIEAVGQTYFQPFSLYDPKHPAYFSLDGATVEDIKRRNPSLAPATFHTVRTEAPRPYLIVNSTLVGPAALAPFKVESLVGFEYTPLYIGSPFGLDITFQPKSGEDETRSIGGGFIEPFAFSGPAPTDAPFNCQPASPASTCTQIVPASEVPYTLVDASGTSSAAFAATLEGSFLERYVPDLSKLTPEELYWPISRSGNQTTTNIAFGDGGNLENYGLIALLLRKVEAIVVFINTETKLNLNYNASNPPGTGDIDFNLGPLFGFPTGNQVHNQVFAQAAFKKLVDALQRAKRAGKTVMATTQLQVQDNHWWGVEGGWRVTICWVYNDRVKAWEDQLNPKTHLRCKIELGNLPFLKKFSPFKDFPNYLTLLEDPIALVELTPEQVNLLADLSCWNVTENADVFRSLLPACR